MKFSALLAAVAAPLLALAQTDSYKPNYFTLDSNFSATAGQSVLLTWHPDTAGTISLILRSGASSDLAPGHVIATGLPNTGSYTWAVSPDVTRNSDYALEIQSDEDPTVVNYSAHFVIESTLTVPTSTYFSAVTTAAASSMTGSSSSSVMSLSTIGTSVVLISNTNSHTTMTGTVTTSTNTVTRTTTSSMSSSTSPGAAPRATAMAGMLGMVALGALAL